MDKEHAALRLDADGRVLGAAWHRTQPEGAVIIRRSELPEGDVTQYRYVDGGFVYDPLPETPEPVETTMPERVAELERQNAMLTECLLEMSGIVYG